MHKQGTRQGRAGSHVLPLGARGQQPVLPPRSCLAEETLGGADSALC